MPGRKNILERRSGLRPSKKELPKRRSGAFRHKNIPGFKTFRKNHTNNHLNTPLAGAGVHFN
jgi:hypothetical protein